VRYYPVFLDIKGRPCLVVGGGTVAERKVFSLLAAGANVTVMSPKATRGLAELARQGRITLLKKAFTQGSLKGFVLCFAATGSAGVNEAVWHEAQKLGVPVNVVDDPAHCSFIVPSVVDRGALTIAISTSGKSPALARSIRLKLEDAIGEEYGPLVEVLGAVRKKLLKTGLNRDKKESIIRDLVKSPLPGLIRSRDLRGINALLRAALGKGYSLGALGVRIKTK